MAQDAPTDLRVGTKDAPPFAMQDKNGEWTGISIELWQDVASRLGMQSTFVETDLEGLVSGLEDGSIDVSVAALSITASRESRIDFTHPFFTSGLGIAVSASGSAGWGSILTRFPLVPFLKVVALLAAVLLIAGMVVWLFERRKNAEQFGGGVRGIGHAFWWSAVTMTTVGYGDKAPATLGGRLVGLVWMFGSVFLISAFTATIASTLTTQQLRGKVNGPEDLPRARLGAVVGSTGAAYLDRKRLTFAAYSTPADALQGLADDHIDAVIYDRPILRYLALRDFNGRLDVLAHRLDEQNYGIGLPSGSPLREVVNRELLEVLSEPSWADLTRRYLGE